MKAIDENCPDVQKYGEESEQQLKLLLELTPLAFISYDTGFHVINWNPAAEKIFGYTATEAIGRHVSFILYIQRRHKPGSALRKKWDNNVLLEFIIKDTGIGIPEHMYEKLFQSFSQGDDSNTRRYGGTGLGPAICKQLVEMMQGEIWVKSEVNAGSEFHFTAVFGVF